MRGIIKVIDTRLGRAVPLIVLELGSLGGWLMADDAETKNDKVEQRSDSTEQTARENLSNESQDLSKQSGSQSPSQERNEISQASENMVKDNKLPGLELDGFDDKSGSSTKDSKNNSAQGSDRNNGVQAPERNNSPQAPEQNKEQMAPEQNPAPQGSEIPNSAEALSRSARPIEVAGLNTAAKNTAASNPADAFPTSVPKGPTVRVDTKFVGTNRSPGEGSGFLVAPDGKKNEPIDGKRLIATAAHVVGESSLDGGEGSVFKTLGKNFQSADGDGNKQLSKDEISKQASIPENSNATAAQKADAREKQFQFNHILQNFDKINAISKELAGTGSNMPGITEAGLKEYYKRSADVTVKTSQGDFKAAIVGIDSNTDAALIEIKGLNPKTEQALGDNIPLATGDPKKDEAIKTEGFRGIPGFKRSDGSHARFFTKDVGQFLFKAGSFEGDPRHVSQIVAHPGMSGGPTLNGRGEAIGVNSAIGELNKKNLLFSTPSSEIVKQLRARMKK